MDPIRTLAENIRAGSGNHGLSEDAIYQILSNASDIEQFAYTLRKCAELSGSDFFSTQKSIITKPNFKDFTAWHHIDEKWNKSWGFEKTQPGCYIYGLFDVVPLGPANFLDSAVFYIGESRAVTRNCMLGRRTDFRGTVRNPRLSPYGVGTAFKEKIGAENINKTYQAYLPMHPSLCKTVELELLSIFYQTHNKIPDCNPELDLTKVQKFLDDH